MKTRPAPLIEYYTDDGRRWFIPLVSLHREPRWLPCNEPVNPFVSARLLAKREGKPTMVTRSVAQTKDRAEYVALQKTVRGLTAALTVCATHAERRAVRQALADARIKATKAV
jgi:hypothetical protein